MPYASYGHSPERREDEYLGGSSSSPEISLGKSIAKVYGYMGIGLAITGVVAFLAAWLFSSQINFGLEKNDAFFTQSWVMAYLGVVIVSFVAMLVLSFVIPVRLARGGKSIWVPYILYSVFMGFLLTAILLAGIDFYIIGEAFLITSVAFAAMFLIGWFTKANIAPLAYIAMALGMMILVAAISGIIILAFRGFTADQIFWFDMGLTGAMCVLILIITIIDTYRIRRLLENGRDSTNIHLFCAYIMYCDFISLLIRVIYILARAKGR